MRYVFLLAALMTLTGCATIINGTTQEIAITSEPAGARVVVNGFERGSTPIVLKLERDETYVMTIKKDGFEDSSLSLNKSVSGWVWGNILLGGLIGLAVDLGAGGMYVLDPPQAQVTLSAKPQQPVALAP